MIERIIERLQNLKEELDNLKNPDRVWIKEKCGMSKNERINKCEILIEELNNLMN